MPQIPRHWLYEWTDERVAKLRILVANGTTFTDAAIALFGTKKARGAVAGKAWRLGLLSSSTRALAMAEKQKQRDAVSRLNRQKPRHAFGAPPSWLRDLGKEFADLTMVPPDPEFRCTLVELESNNCRYPVGDPQKEDFRFCGRPITRQGSYCNHCAEHLTFKPGRDVMPVEVLAARTWFFPSKDRP